VAGSGSVRISVSDRGSGIPAEFQDKIFAKFSQADASDSRKMGGTGLGLSIAKAIVEKHGGEIGFRSNEGGGTTFHFDLPLALGAPQDAGGGVQSASNEIR
jgi:signal transduction histidine kinase